MLKINGGCVKKLLLLLMGFLLVLVSTSCQENTRLKWKLKLGPNCTAPAVAEDGTVYVGCMDGRLYAIKTDEEIKWQDTIYSARFNDLAVGEDGTLYAGTRDGSIYTVSRDKKFNPVDTLSPPQAVSPHYCYDTRENEPAYLALADDGSVIIACNYMIFALDTLFYKFELRWNYNPPDVNHFEFPPAIGADGIVYVADIQGHLYAINPDGTTKWTQEIPGRVTTSPVIDKDGTIYIGSLDGSFHATNPDGSSKWRYIADEFISSPAAIGSDGTIYFGCGDGHIYALNNNGTLKWRYKTTGRYFTSPVVGANGVIYAGRAKAPPRTIYRNMFHKTPFIYAINPDGTLKWKYRVNASISNPTLAKDGTLYFTCSKYLYALQTSSPGLAESPWPKFGA